jgi:hypothetical protein
MVDPSGNVQFFELILFFRAERSSVHSFNFIIGAAAVLYSF